MISRRVLTLSSLGLLTGASLPALAQTAYPERALRMLVGFAPGGANDALARLIATPLAADLGQPVVVENRPGVGSTVAIAEVARARPDGHMLVLGATGGHAIAPALYSRLPYDAAKDVLPVTLVAHAANALVVHAGLPVKDLRELIQYAKTHPGSWNYASPGNGTIAHLAGELFKSMADVNIVHVPYKGDSPALADVMSGQTQMTFASLPSALSGVRSGKVRILAVTSARRVPALPDVPTIAEAGVAGYDFSTWYGVFTTGGTPPAVVERLARQSAQIVAQPATAEAIRRLGVEPATSTPAEFRRFVSAEMTRWGKVARDVGVKLD
jgi:tripartite-type tricarboxylate transporter receptor subunit TctC